MANEVKIRLALTGASQVTDSLRLIGSAFGRLQAALPALSAVAVFAGLSALTKHAIDTADAMGKLAQKTGIAVDALSGLAYSAKLGDVSQETLTSGLKKLQQEMVKAGEGGSDVQEKLLNISEEFKNMADGAQKSARAVELFGKQGLELIPFLNQGADAIRRDAEEARRFGLIIGEGFARNADEFNDNLTRMKAIAEGLFLRIAEKLLPSLIALQESLIKFASDSQVIAFFDALTKRIAIFAAGVVFATDVYLAFSKALIEVAQSISSVNLAGAAAGVATANPVAAVVNLIKLFKDASIAGPVNKALDTIDKAFQGYAKRLDEIDQGTKEAASGTKELNDELTGFIKLQNQQFEIGVKLLQLEAQRARIETDFTQTQAQKWAQRKFILEEEFEQQRNLLNIIQERMNQPGLTQAERDQLTGQATSAQSRLTGIERQSGALGPDPNSFSEQWSAAIAKLQDQLGTFAQNVAQTFTGIIGGAIDTISNQFANVIIGTETWSKALANIGQSLLQNILQGIIKIGLQWVTNLILQATVGKAVQAAALAFSTGIAAAFSGIWAAPATLATIASYGGAAIAAPGEIAAAKGIVLAQSAVGFSEGGYTGNGGINQPAGMVHGKEFVFSAPATSNLGVQTLEAMHNAALGGSWGSPSVSVGGPKITNAFFLDESAIRQLIRSKAASEEIVNVVAVNLSKIGVA